MSEDPLYSNLTLTEALKAVYESKGSLVCGSTSVPGDAIAWDALRGWIWAKSGAHPHFMHPSIMLGTWIVGERTEEEFRK
jgi:hypothetical protein